MASPTVRSDLILRAIAKHVGERFAWFTEVKNGPTWYGSHLRMDGAAIRRSYTQVEIRGYEVKVSRSDFLRDDKWPGYLPYCHRLSFACPKGLIQPEELPQEVGLLWFNPETQALSTKRAAVYRPLPELPWEFLLYVLISKLDDDRHPFFSSERELLEAWVKDKDERKGLGRAVGQKLRMTLGDALTRASLAEAEAKNYRQARERLDALEAELHGLLGWGWEHRLGQLQATALPFDVVQQIDGLARQADRLRDAAHRDPGKEVEAHV